LKTGEKMNTTKTVGIIGLGSMGGNVAKLLRKADYDLVLYNKNQDNYGPFKGKGVQCAKDPKDFALKLSKSQSGPATIWMMVPGGAVTNELAKELSSLLGKESIIIDASNSIYTDSIKNAEVLRKKGIYYLDVGCAGGPDDLLKGVALMVGGDKSAFTKSEEIFKTVSGSGTYGYVGPNGSGHMAKLVHNIIFYGLFPVYSEGSEMLLSMKKENPGLEVGETLRLLSKSPPINYGIMEAILETMKDGKLPAGEAPQMTVSAMVQSGITKAGELGVRLDIIKAILADYPRISDDARKINGAAKRKLTGH
jgi:6-phosphogluconate dehydrogenase